MAGASDESVAPNHVAVCLTGQLRWFALTLANVQHLLLNQMQSSRLYYVGPHDPLLEGAAERMLMRMGAGRQDLCTYNATVTWEWGQSNQIGEPTGPFEMHGASVCASRPVGQEEKPAQLRFNARWLPLFRRCLAHTADRTGERPNYPLGFDPDETPNRLYNQARAAPCSAGVSLIMQLWQSSQCIQLIKAAETRETTAATFSVPRRHDAVLRLRTDIFFFRPIVLPQPRRSQGDTWYSMLEDTCGIQCGIAEKKSGVMPARFLQDFWLYGSRKVMDVALAEPLRVLLRLGKEYLQIMLNPDHSEHSTPKYYYHPIPHLLAERYNETRHCLPYTQRYGLLRINVGLRCFFVQARVGSTGSKLSWRELAVTMSEMQSAREDRWLGEDAAHFLPAVATIYRRCFGLAADNKCPRVVGDRNLFHGVEGACLRSNVTSNCSASTLPVLNATGKLGQHAGIDAQQALGFACVSEGLQLLQKAGLKARPVALRSTPLEPRPRRKKSPRRPAVRRSPQANASRP